MTSGGDVLALPAAGDSTAPEDGGPLSLDDTTTEDDKKQVRQRAPKLQARKSRFYGKLSHYFQTNFIEPFTIPTSKNTERQPSRFIKQVVKGQSSSPRRSPDVTS